MHPVNVCIVVPAYNEEGSIPGILKAVAKFRLDNPQWVVHALVVNDGSTDQSSKIFDENAGPLDQMIRLPLNVGIGHAVQTGFRWATLRNFGVVIQLDGDGQHPVDALRALVTPVAEGRADVTIGSRYVQGGGGNVSTRSRQLGTWAFSHLLKLLVGVRIWDSTSGFRAFSGAAARVIAEHYAEDYPEVQGYVSLARRGMRILELPVSMRSRETGVSSISAHRSVYYVLKVSLATVVERYRKIS